MLMPKTLIDEFAITNAAVALARRGDTVGVGFAGSPKIAIEEALIVKFATVTCSAYVAPSSITTHDSPSAGVAGMACTADEIVANGCPPPTRFVRTQPADV